MSWRGRLRTSNWIGNTGRYSNWQGARGDALTEPISVVSYGYLYNWHAVNKAVAEDDDGYSLAPEGWRIPDNADWTALETYIDDANDGRKLKSCRQVDAYAGGTCDTNIHPRWDASLIHYGENTYNFSGVPAGRRTTSFIDLGEDLYMWSADGTGDDGYIARLLNSNDAFECVQRTMPKENGGSVRLVRDTDAGDSGVLDGESCGTEVIDGYTYDTVKIGDQVWMVQNLATTKYRNGEDIPNVTDNTDWANDEAGARCAYNNDEGNVFVNFEWL